MKVVGATKLKMFLPRHGVWRGRGRGVAPSALLWCPTACWPSGSPPRSTGTDPGSNTNTHIPEGHSSSRFWYNNDYLKCHFGHSNNSFSSLWPRTSQTQPHGQWNIYTSALTVGMFGCKWVAELFTADYLMDASTPTNIRCFWWNRYCRTESGLISNHCLVGQCDQSFQSPVLPWTDLLHHQQPDQQEHSVQ